MPVNAIHDAATTRLRAPASKLSLNLGQIDSLQVFPAGPRSAQKFGLHRLRNLQRLHMIGPLFIPPSRSAISSRNAALRAGPLNLRALTGRVV